jgi:hypothetical protein
MMENDLFPRTEDDTPPTPATILERRLIWLFLLWLAALLAIRMLAVYSNRGNLLNSPLLWLYELGMLLSPVVTAILVVIALRHHPVYHRFLKVVVAFSLFLMVLTNHTSATVASRGSFFQAWTKDYNLYPSFPLADKLAGLFMKYVTLPAFLGPLTDQNMPLLFFYMAVSQYSLLIGPYFLLLLLITPSFLALPVFWLWMLLSVLYVVLPPRAWGRMRDRAKLSWKRIRHRASSRGPRNE